MNYGFIKAAAVTPRVIVGDCSANADEIINKINEADKQKIQLLVFPELCITGYTCSDLFLQDVLLDNAKESLVKIAENTKDKEMVVVVGMPLIYNNSLYNVACVLCNGDILGIVPKTYIPNYSEFYEKRHFTSGKDIEDVIYISDKFDNIPIATNLIFSCNSFKDFRIGVEICEDLWAVNPPSSNLVLGGATIIVNPSASNEVTGKDVYRKNLVSMQSARCICGYVYADAGINESTTDVVFAGHNIIAENGTVIGESERFKNGSVSSYIDIGKLASERRRIKTFGDESADAIEVEFDIKINDVCISCFDRFVDNMPFVPKNPYEREMRCNEILSIQALGLRKRLEHIGCKHAVIGISGGLDSTLALLVTVRAFDMLGLDRKNIIAVTMPGFGTTDRTYNNAVTMIKSAGATFKEINIADAVTLHLDQIGHDINDHNITYENAQARYRTYLLMDIANDLNGLVIGTGDLSELALGWATYNGDHMSMYGVNGGVPKTLVRHLVKYYADTCGEEELSNVLRDVLATPVSPELLPPENGEISQKTEDVVGPYELHDFFLYYMMRFGFKPDKIYFLANVAFAGKNGYDKETIYKWLRTFYWRFFSQQFKRSCLPDGPKVGSVCLSPRGDLRMPSDASVREWMEVLDRINMEQ